MGRAKKIRELRKIAAELPAIESGKYKYRHPVKGEELIKRGILEVDGKQVDPRRYYINEIEFTMDTNHLKMLKRAYDTGGDLAVNQYVAQAKAIASQKASESK